MDKFEDMVEDLELNEDVVECKECFDLFPKTEGVKLDVGYICPTCHKMINADRAATTPELKLDQFALTNDLYDQEFPDVTEYAPDTTKDWDREPTVMDALDTLIKDEYDAIDAYEEADETIQHLPMDEDEKDDILDTIDHIKEEEEEHIDELKDLTDEDQEEGQEEDQKEDQKEDEDNEEEDEKEIEESADKQTLVESATLPTWVGYTNGGEFVGAVRAATEEEAYERLEREYASEWIPMGYEPDDLMVELATDEEFDDTDYLTEAETGLFGRVANKLGNAAKAIKNKFTKATVNINEIFSKGFYVHIVGPQESEIVDKNGRPCQNQRAQTLDEAEKLAKGHSVRFRNANVEIMAIKDGVTIEDPEIKKLVEKYKWKLEIYNGGRATTTAGRDDINKRIKELVVADQNSSGGGDTFTPVDEIKEKLKKELGAIIPPAGYTEESYAKYKEAYDAIVAEIDAATEASELEGFTVADKKEAAEALLEKPDGGLDSAEDELEEAREACLAILGEKIAPEGYTPESYEKYSKKYDQYKASIENAKQLKTLTEVYPNELKERVPKLNALLQKVSGDGTSDEPTEEDNEDLSVLKKLAIKNLQKGMEKPDNYTEESYASYEEEIQAKIDAVNKATQSSKVQAFIDGLPAWLEKLKALLDPKETPEEEPGDEEEPSDEEDGAAALEEAKKAAFEKLGDKLAGDDYTEESYQKYVDAHDDIIEDIDSCKTAEEVNNIDIDARKEEAEKLLEKPVEPDNSKLDELRAKAKEDLGEKKDAEPYTEDSYTEYSRRFDTIINEIESAESEEDLPDIEKARAYAEEALVEKPKDEVPEEEEDPKDPEEEPEEKSETEKPKITSNQVAAIVRSVFQKYGQTPEKKVINRLKDLLKQHLGESLGTEEEIRKLITEALETGKLGEELLDTDGALASLADTTKKLKSAAAGMKNMTQAMREEYHKYANPAELKAMEDLEAVIETAKDKVLQTMNSWGIDITESDGQGWLSGNNEYTYQIMVDYEGVDEDEEEDIQDQLLNMFENEVLANYKLPAEISNITCSVMLPDPDIAYDEDDEEELRSSSRGSSRGSILVEVTFARNLIASHVI